MKYVEEVQPGTVMEIYKEHGTTITLEQAEWVIRFLYLIADIALDKFEKEIAEKEGEQRSPAQ